MRAFYFMQTTNRWLYLQVGVVASIATFFVGILLLLGGHTTAGLAGFTLTFARSFSFFIYQLIRDYTDLEVGLNRYQALVFSVNISNGPNALAHTIDFVTVWRALMNTSNCPKNQIQGYTHLLR